MLDNEKRQKYQFLNDPMKQLKKQFVDLEDDKTSICS